MKKSKKQNYEYLAFISYQRKDEAIAKRLQHTLEFYNLPITIIEKEPELKDGIRPIFVDMTELGDEPFLKPAIEKALKESRFLIVICSPRSAKSKWVNKEVQYFLRLKRTKRIIPFIIEGTPNAQLENEECCTPLLQHLLGKRELLGVNINEMGFDAAAVKVVSRMFHIGFRNLWNRYEKEKEEEQRKLKEQNDRLLIAQSRYVAAKVKQLVRDGDSYSARLLALEILPSSKNQNRPYTTEATEAMYMSLKNETAILKTKYFYPYTSGCISNDDKTIVTGNQYGEVFFWNTFTGRLENKLKGHDGQINDIRYSHNGQFLVTASDDHTVIIWDKRGVKIKTLYGHLSEVEACTFSHDGKYIVSCSCDKEIRLWDVETADCINILTGHTDCVSCLCITNDNVLISSSWDKTIRIWNISDKKCMKIIGGFSNYISHIFLCKKTGLLIVASWDGLIKLLDIKTGNILKIFSGHHGPVNSVCMDVSNNLLISTSDDKTVCIWSISTGEIIHELNGHMARVNYASFFNGTSNKAFSVSDDATVRIWDLRPKDEIIKVIEDSSDVKYCADFNISCRHLWVGYSDGIIKMWDLNKSRCVKQYELTIDKEREQYVINSVLEVFLEKWGFYSDVTSLSLTKDGCFLLAVCGITIKVIDLNTNSSISTLYGHKGIINSAYFSSDSRIIISASDDNDIRLWDWRKERCFLTIKGQDASVSDATFINDKTKIVSVSADKIISIWNAVTGERLKDIILVDGVGDKLSISPNGMYVLIICEDNIKIYDINTGVCVKEIKMRYRTEKVQFAIFSPSGREIITSSFVIAQNHSKLRFWDTSTGVCIRDISVDDPNIEHLRICSNEKLLLWSPTAVYIMDYCELANVLINQRNRFGSRTFSSEERREYYLE